MFWHGMIGPGRMKRLGIGTMRMIRNSTEMEMGGTSCRLTVRTLEIGCGGASVDVLCNIREHIR